MNLVGKIFVVLILVMSVVWGAFTVAVYSNNRNWMKIVLNPKEKVTREDKLGLKWQLINSRERNDQLDDQLQKLEEDLDREKKAAVQVRSKLETENDELKRENEQLERRQAELDQRLREAAATLQTSHNTLATLRTEVDGLRKDIRTAQTDRDDHFKKLVALTDQLHQAVNEIKRLKERNKELAEELARAEAVLRLHGLDKDKDYSGTPPIVDGIVLAVSSSGLVEISIGADDGLMKGHRLEVYRRSTRGNTYVGRIEVVRTAPDKSVCKIDPKYMKSPVQKGDRVTTRLQ